MDWTRPDATGIPLADPDSVPKPGEAVLVPVPENGDPAYVAELRMGASTGWPGVRTDTPATRDLNDCAGLAMDVKNVGVHAGELGWEIGIDKWRQWYSYYTFRPGEEYTISVRTEALELLIRDLDRIGYVQVVTRRNQTPLRFRLGPIRVIPKQAGRN